MLPVCGAYGYGREAGSCMGSGSAGHEGNRLHACGCRGGRGSMGCGSLVWLGSIIGGVPKVLPRGWQTGVWLGAACLPVCKP